jgi:hypothetical protein
MLSLHEVESIVVCRGAPHIQTVERITNRVIHWHLLLLLTKLGPRDISTEGTKIIVRCLSILWLLVLLLLLHPERCTPEVRRRLLLIEVVQANHWHKATFILLVCEATTILIAGLGP